MVIFPCFVQCFDTLALVTGWAFGLYGIINKPATVITSGFFGTGQITVLFYTLY